MLQLPKPDKTLAASPQIFDLLQLSRRERDYKILCLHAIRKFEDWKRAQEKSSVTYMKMHVRIEGIRLRLHARNAMLFYKMIKRDRIEAFQRYMGQLPQRAVNFQTAS